MGNGEMGHTTAMRRRIKSTIIIGTMLLAGGCSFSKLSPTEIVSETDLFAVAKTPGNVGQQHAAIAEFTRAAQELFTVTLKDGQVSTLTPKVGVSGDKLYEYLDAGQNLSSIFCSDFLEGLGNANARVEYSRKLLILGAALTEGFLGVFDANATTAITTALGFATAQSVLDGYQEFAFFSANQDALAKLVKQAQAEVRRGNEENRPTSISGAIVALQTFERQCTRNGIRNLVLAAVKSADLNYDRGSQSVTARALTFGAGISAIAARKLELETDRRARLKAKLAAELRATADPVKQAAIAAAQVKIDTQNTKMDGVLSELIKTDAAINQQVRNVEAVLKKPIE